MQRAIVGYHRDEEGHWVAELDCGHGQHVRHAPPFTERRWVTTPEGRASRLGVPLGCRRCERRELPEGLRLVDTTEAHESALPAWLCAGGPEPTGVWIALHVREGRLRLRLGEPLVEALELAAGGCAAVPPGVRFRLEPRGPLRLAASRRVVAKGAADGTGRDEGGA